MNLNIPICSLSGVGPKIEEKLSKAGIKTVQDLLYNYPRKWEDFRNFTPISWVRRDEVVTIKGRIKRVDRQRTKLKNMVIVKARIEDETGEINAIWFNQGFIEKMLVVNSKITLHGKIDWDFNNKERILSSPTIVKEERILPVYCETGGISTTIIEKITKSALRFVDNIIDWVPNEIKEEYDLIDLTEALKQIHHPSSFEALEAAKLRLAFDELFLISLSMAMNKEAMEDEKGIIIPRDTDLVKKFLEILPFQLTEAQKKAAWEIIRDLEKPHPMNRLVEGDVGSGKTIVGVIAALSVIKSGWQVAWMAPTEILAKQHYNTVSNLLSNFNIKTALVTGSVKEDYSQADMIIGTQALIQDKMKYEKLGLIIVDEQHRFGVAQRAKLRVISEKLPHFLSMTATPIPRTLALTLYGDLDISIIDQLPEGRQNIKTRIVSPSERERAYHFISDQIKQGRQVFVICPLIDQSKGQQADQIFGNELDYVDKKSAVQEYNKLKDKIFPQFKIGLLHGKMKAREKEIVMTEFSKGGLDILVSTAVVEVGIDIPNASVMMIEGAERFGLAQLHQFRGRVGRGKYQSYCMLFTESWEESTQKRLQAMVESSNGFELAQKDLEQRGPGELTGIRQSGLPDLKMASLTDIILIQKARKAAQETISRGLDKYPELKQVIEEFQKIRHME